MYNSFVDEAARSRSDRFIANAAASRLAAEARSHRTGRRVTHASPRRTRAISHPIIFFHGWLAAGRM